MVLAIHEAVTASGRSHTELSHAIGHHGQWLGRVLRGEIKHPKAIDIEKLEHELGVELRAAASLLDNLPPMIRIPVIQEGSASLKGGVVIDHVFMPRSVIAGTSEQHIVGIQARGTCLSPTIEDGDTALVDTSATAVPGDVVAVSIENELHLKKYRTRGSRHYVYSNEGEALIEPYQIEGVMIGFFRMARR